MRHLLPLAVFASIATGATGVARAEGPPWGVPHVDPPPSRASASTADGDPQLALPLAFAINVPFAWSWSVAFSAWAGIDDHHAIRANFARYRGPLWELIPNRLASDGPEEGDLPADFGATTDLSVGWVYYPRRVLDGATFEASALLRVNRLRDSIDRMNVASEEQHTNMYGARALVGWTWRLSDWWFIALSAGASAGYERGREKVFLGYAAPPQSTDIIREGRVSRAAVSGEAYLRVGLAFGQ